MSRNLLAGLGAGLISFIALMSATTGSPPIQFMLFVTAPLPVFLAGLGLGWATGAIAAITAGIALTLLAGPLIGFISATAQLGPAVLLTYLATLNRPVVGPDGQAVIEWYPVGRLVIWAAVLGTMLSVLLLTLLGATGGDIQSTLQKVLRQAIEQTVSQQADGTKLSDADLETMTKVTVALLPAASAILMTAILLLNLFTAARITQTSGYLSRPWPDIAAMTFPSGASLALAGTLIASMLLTGFPGMIASAAAGGAFFAYVVLGLAVIHYVTRGNQWRGLILWAIYLAMFIFNTGFALLVALIGLTEPFSPLKRDFMQRPPGPPSGPHSGTGPGPGNPD
ncbi:MAG: YybS family protein [Alphaproteobacteria bacterium]|nr:YybS family protein [Alphaproteobacteria bacterium]